MKRFIAAAVVSLLGINAFADCSPVFYSSQPSGGWSVKLYMLPFGGNPGWYNAKLTFDSTMKTAVLQYKDQSVNFTVNCSALGQMSLTGKKDQQIGAPQIMKGSARAVPSFNMSLTGHAAYSEFLLYSEN